MPPLPVLALRLMTRRSVFVLPGSFSSFSSRNSAQRSSSAETWLCGSECEEESWEIDMHAVVAYYT